MRDVTVACVGAAYGEAWWRPQGAVELRMIGADHDRPHVGIDEILDASADALKRLRAGDQR